VTLLNRKITIYDFPMALARKENFHQKDMDLADFAKALGHPARIAILTTLAIRKECICGDLVIDLPLAQSTVSQHLKALKDLGLIRGEVDGPKSRYCIDWKVFNQYRRKLRDWADRMDILMQTNCC